MGEAERTGNVAGDELDCGVEVETVVQLLRKARGGDEACRDELFAACRNYLNLLARARVEGSLRRKVDASDLVQQTLLEAHRDFERFDGSTEGEWLAWLRRILAHNMADYIRHYRTTQKRGAAREVSIDQGQDDSLAMPIQLMADDGTPSRMVMQQDDELRLARAMMQLSEDHREVIVLRNMQALPFDQVAERMERSRPACQMLWMRAIKKLQELLEAEGEEPS